jgi:hypothetical protein
MKTISFLLFFLGCSLRNFSQLVAEYRFESVCSNLACVDICHGAGDPNPFYVDVSTLSSASVFSLGSGVTGAGSLCGASNMNGFSAGEAGNPNRARWASGWSSVFSATDYFSFTLTAQPSILVTIDSIVWRERVSVTGPSVREVRLSFDGFSNSIWVDSSPLDAWVTKRVVGGIPSFSSLAGLEIRIYGYGASNSSGSLRVDHLKVYAHESTVLPVNLLSFEAIPSGDMVELFWVTGSENDNSHFEVERLTVEGESHLIGIVTGAGYSFTENSYYFTDDSPSLYEVNYYRLVQVDFDGSRTPSHVLTVSFGEVGDTPLDVFDFSGRLLLTTTRLSIFSGTCLTQGVYLIRDSFGRIKKVVVP